MIVENVGDEARGERIICIYRKASHPYLIHATGGHKGTQMWISGLPTRAIVDKAWRLTKNV